MLMQERFISNGLPISDLEEVLADSSESFKTVDGTRLFVTGGTGFCGRWMLESLAFAVEKLGLDVKTTVLTRNPADFLKRNPTFLAHKWIEFISGDVRTFEFPDGRFDGIVHLATSASARLNAEEPVEMFDTIVTGTRRVLDFAFKAGASSFFLASSGAVYGRQPPELTHVPEEYCGGPDTTAPVSAYAEGKRAAEFLCSAYAARHGFAVKVARGFAFVGPYLPLDAHYAIGNFIRDGLAGGPIIVKGDGTPCRSYMYGSDLASWLWKILISGRPGEAYNVGSEEAVSIRGLAEIVASVFSPSPEAKVAVPAGRDAPAERYIPSTAKAKRELGTELRVGLKEAVSRTVEHARLMRKK
jgi:dTDP-glucose 4,6-dehydratase